MFKLGTYLDREFSWSRGTTISRLTESDAEIGTILSSASRAAREHVRGHKFGDLQNVASSAAQIAKNYGVNSDGDLKPAIDTQMSGMISLHDENVPIRLSGLGSRRLLAIGMQKEATDLGSILLVDEIEHGLEPHRLRHLIHKLAPEEESGQVIYTSHSPTAVAATSPGDIFVVQNRSGVINVKPLPTSLTESRLIRRTPETLLGRKILVCEGKTELALCGHLDIMWSDDGLSPLSTCGVVGILPEAGGGNVEGPSLAQAIAGLGYDVAFFGDSDEPTKPTANELVNSGLNVILWDDEMSTEERVFCDLPWCGIVELVGQHIETIANFKRQNGIESENAISTTLEKCASQILSSDNNDSTARSMARELRTSQSNYQQVIEGWNSENKELEVRQILGRAAKKGSWYKSGNLAPVLARVVTNYYDSVPGEADLKVKIIKMRLWIDE